MKKLFTLAFLLVFLCSADIEVSDIKFTEKLAYKGSNFILNGAGVKEQYYIDLYVLGLYLKKKSDNAEDILKSNKSQVMRLVCVSSLITSERFNEAMETGFYKATNGNPAPYKKEIDILKKAFGGTWSENDEFLICYNPTTGIQLYKNKELKATIKKGIEFKSLIMKIWLGPQCVSDDLKDSLLGN